MNYSKLSGRAGSLMAHHQIWQGTDHLLVVKEVGCVEEYKRFYFNDIQAFIVVRSANYLVWAILLPLISACIFALGMNAGDGRPFVNGLGIVLLIFWLVHLVRGLTCKCWIQTGINKEQLMMIKRVRAARKFWSRIQPELVAVQGEFSLDDMEREGTFVENVVPEPPPVFQGDSEPGAALS
ncbi:hypothetical protein P4C99_14220 [Pontiellaceae bacterium B1224]|nr:hypothetical protein [Pontiellaceae bacterium B1224]